MKRILSVLAGMLLAGSASAQPHVLAAPSASRSSSAAGEYRSRCTEVVTGEWLRRFDITNAIGPAFIKISFQVSPEGHPIRLVVHDATNGAVTLRRTVLEAAKSCRFDPIPADAVKELGSQPLMVNMEFALRIE